MRGRVARTPAQLVPRRDRVGEADRDVGGAEEGRVVLDVTRESGDGLRQPPARKKIPSIWSILPDTGSPKPGSTDARVNPIPARYPSISR